MKTPTEAYCEKIEQAFSILGQRWSGLILHALLHGPKRFSQLIEVIPNISARMLTLRLKTLENHNIIMKENNVYTLTKKGYQLNTAIEDLRQWVLDNET